MLYYKIDVTLIDVNHEIVELHLDNTRIIFNEI